MSDRIHWPMRAAPRPSYHIPLNTGSKLGCKITIFSGWEHLVASSLYCVTENCR